jgi:hypothetical protein
MRTSLSKTRSFCLWQVEHMRMELVVNIRVPHFKQRFQAFSSSNITRLGIYCLLLLR